MNFSTVFVVSAVQQGLIGGARRANIKFVEIQHGAISRLHPMFNWEFHPEAEAVADEFWVWGPFWVEGIRFARKTKPVVVGANSSYEEIRSNDTHEVAKQVIFMSSADVTEKLFAVALDVAKCNPEYKFIYKGHPREVLDQQISLLKSTPEVKNLQIIEKNYSSLELIKSSELVVGVNSTTLYEAAGMSKKVAVVQIPGWEISRDFIDAGGATLMTGEQLSISLQEVKRVENPESFYSIRDLKGLQNY